MRASTPPVAGAGAGAGARPDQSVPDCQTCQRACAAEGWGSGVSPGKGGARGQRRGLTSAAVGETAYSIRGSHYWSGEGEFPRPHSKPRLWSLGTEESGGHRKKMGPLPSLDQMCWGCDTLY